jgi:hypothetical protein
MPKTKKTKKSHSQTSHSASHSHSHESKKAHLDFYGADVLKRNVPQAYELAEAVVQEWKKDGSFQKLPLNNSLAQFAAAVTLKNAKRLEKSLEERGVFTMAKSGLEYARTKWHAPF